MYGGPCTGSLDKTEAPRCWKSKIRRLEMSSPSYKSLSMTLSRHPPQAGVLRSVTNHRSQQSTAATTIGRPNLCCETQMDRRMVSLYKKYTLVSREPILP